MVLRVPRQGLVTRTDALLVSSRIAARRRPLHVDRDRMVPRREDADLILDAMAYVDTVHMDLAAENTAPAPGVAGRVVAAILADPSLSDYVRTWASERRALEASAAPPHRPPVDATYARVRDLLRRAGDRLVRTPN